jgi:2-polyprenyl-6-methoxyphenol hydroxylase-like FAD-dependent oxidoreductase
LDTDVLIVGAGPTGLMLACQLARRGVRCAIIDRHAGPARETRALGVQARTMEIYAKLGIVDRALDLGKRGTGANLWAEGRWMARVPLGDAGRDVSPYPYVLILGQDDNERIMGERLADLGVSIQWSTELIGLEQNAECATAQIKRADGTTSVVTAAWIAGCDGAHSTVREKCGIEFIGAPYEHVFFVADTQSTGGMVPDEVNVYLRRAGFHLFFPMRGVNHWRIVGIVPSAIRDREDVTFESVLPSILSEVGLGLTVVHCSWFSTYRIAHRRAQRFRDGRSFLLGDAAHVHSPVGAQGMNTGLQDAYNLAWKLALVTSGRANAAVLDSYEEERVPVAEQLLNTTDRAFKLVVADSALLGLIRTEVVARIGAFAMTFERTQRLAFRVVSQTGIHYRESRLSSSLPGFTNEGPRAGDRFPWLKLKLRADGPIEDLFDLDDTRFHLVVFGQSSAMKGDVPYPDILDVHDVTVDPVNEAALNRAHIPRPSFYLLRPDGHVGLCGSVLDLDACRSYLHERLQFGVMGHEA